MTFLEAVVRAHRIWSAFNTVVIPDYVQPGGFWIHAEGLAGAHRLNASGEVTCGHAFCKDRAALVASGELAGVGGSR